MPKFTRREILRALAAVGLSQAFWPFGPRGLVFGAESAKAVLVVVHLRGGCDGLNLISPANDPNFIAARASDLRVASEGKDAGYPLGSTPAANIDFRLHPAGAGLFELYKSGNLAFVHACGLTNATRSHFVATDMIEAGVASQSQLARVGQGWLTRAIQAMPSDSLGLDAVAVSQATAGDLNGLGRAMAIPDLGNGLPVIGGLGVASALWQMYAGNSGAVGLAGQEALKLPAAVDQRLPRDSDDHVLPYSPENGANYDASGGLANTLKTMARLVKMDIGLQAMTFDYGNWDTHENQPARFRGQLEPLSNGLAAFWNDIHAYHDRVVMVAISEFGRRLRGNKSNGTDHGRAGVIWVLGGKVRGGRMLGPWPGLDSPHLEEGVDLGVATDYRQVLSETVQYLSARDNPALFPDFKSTGKIGLFV